MCLLSSIIFRDNSGLSLHTCGRQVKTSFLTTMNTIRRCCGVSAILAPFTNVVTYLLTCLLFLSLSRDRCISIIAWQLRSASQFICTSISVRVHACRKLVHKDAIIVKNGDWSLTARTRRLQVMIGRFELHSAG